MHFINTFLIVIYIILSYYQEPENDSLLMVVLAIGIVYPACYELFQMKRFGVSSYFLDTWNYVDITFISCSMVNVYA